MSYKGLALDHLFATPLDPARRRPRQASFLEKARIYVHDPADAPRGARLQHGPRGGTYYEDRATTGTRPHTPGTARQAGTAAPPTAQPPRPPSHAPTGQRPNPYDPTKVHRRLPDPDRWDPRKDGTTSDVYRHADGSYGHRRQALHDQIVHQLTAHVPPAQRPAVYLMGGGTAAGKSTLLSSGKVTVPDAREAVYVDPDGIKAMLPEYEPLTAARNPAAAAIVHDESRHISKQALRAAAGNRQHVVLDGTGDMSVDSLQNKLDAFRRAGHRIVATYVTVPTELALRNARARGDRTGRYVPEGVIRNNHRAVSSVLPQALRAGLFDEATLYDNSEKGNPRLVLSHKDGRTTVHEPDLWRVFLDKARQS